jgi:hypothetical protein
MVPDAARLSPIHRNTPALSHKKASGSAERPSAIHANFSEQRMEKEVEHA